MKPVYAYDKERLGGILKRLCAVDRGCVTFRHSGGVTSITASHPLGLLSASYKLKPMDAPYESAEFSVAAERLYRIVSLYDGDEVAITLKRDGHLEIIGDLAHWELMPITEQCAMEIGGGDECSIVAVEDAQLMKAVKRIAPIGDDDIGCLFEVDKINKKLIIVATDKRRLIKVELDANVKGNSVQGAILTSLLRNITNLISYDEICNEAIKIYLNSNYLSIRTTNCTVTTALLSNMYPCWRKITDSFTGKLVLAIERDALILALKRAASVVNINSDALNYVKLSADNNELCASVESEYGNSKVFIAGVTEPMEILLNCRYINDFQLFDKRQLNIYYTSKRNPLRIVSGNTEYFVMPVVM